MLYMNAYWLNNGLFMLLVRYVLLYVVALCVKMRYVILCIKRLFTDWLIEVFFCILALSVVCIRPILLHKWGDKF